MSGHAEIFQLCADSRFAQVVPDGFEFAGAEAGPVVLVAAPPALAKAIFERMLQLPSLPWMRGTIRLVKLEQDITALPDQDQIYDELLCLPLMSTAAPDPLTVQLSLKTVLMLCARLGMISGRGLGDTRMLSEVA